MEKNCGVWRGEIGIFTTLTDGFNKTTTKGGTLVLQNFLANEENCNC